MGQPAESTGKPKTKPIAVDVLACPTGGGGVDFDQVIKDHAHDHGGKIKAPDKEGCEIHFRLKPEAGLDIRFDAAAPFFVQEIASPPCPGSMASKQMMVVSCTAEDLVVIDWNYAPEVDLHYQLNFTNEVGTKSYHYDPVIKNTGGGIRPT